MGVYIPNMKKPKDCSECILADKHLNGLYEAKYYCRLAADSCPLIELEEWNSFSNGKMYAPKGTFQAILDDERRADERTTE